jgi:hypothetical protein
LNDGSARTYWRVGYHADPLSFRPLQLYHWSYRFDDVHHRFRSVYVAEMPETSLREVLSDLRPKAAAIHRYVKKFGPDAAADVPSQPVTADWRQKNVLVATHLELDGPMIDLCDTNVRNDIEQEYIALLVQHDLDHLDMNAITLSKRVVTQTIAADLHDKHGAAAVRFPSKHDGNACVAIFEKRGGLLAAADPISLTDPPPAPLQTVCAGWKLELEPAAASIQVD